MQIDDIEEIYEEYSELVYRYLLCLTNDAAMAEELTQETFYQAMKGIEKFRSECKVSVWLCQIGKNLWYKELRSKRRSEIPIEAVCEVALKENLEEWCIANLEVAEFYTRLKQLDEVNREVVYLRLAGELSFAQIGKILEKSENWARVSFYRSKQKIMKEMNKHGA
ncbi:RNA polymerase sigma factor [Konateibacter massiliensis]|uniref:RNA polymerase sigma factor n=1 Tax=Konateibacter massiliensis TaxID=2002841 RepID=UPI000C15C829|nr:sigma-70 family RNA polymerase sigma factor [Konateibacter massiliensis]